MVKGDVVGATILPAAPQDADPGSGEDTNGVGVIAAAGAGVGIDGRGPGGGVTGVVGKRRERLAQALVAGPAEADGPLLARGAGDRSHATFGGELLGRGEARAVIAELGQDLGRIDFAAAGQGLDERAIGVLRQGRGDRRRELLDLGDEGGEHGDHAPDDFAAGLGFGLAHSAQGGCPKAGEELPGGAAAAIGVLGQEPAQALFAQALGALGRRIAGEKGQSDRRIDVGEEGPGARPETLEQGTQLIGPRATRWATRASRPPPWWQLCRSEPVSSVIGSALFRVLTREAVIQRSA